MNSVQAGNRCQHRLAPVPASAIGARTPRSLASVLAHRQPSVAVPSPACFSGSFGARSLRPARPQRAMKAQAKRITQNDFTEKAWSAITGSVQVQSPNECDTKQPQASSIGATTALVQQRAQCPDACAPIARMCSACTPGACDACIRHRRRAACHSSDS